MQLWRAAVLVCLALLARTARADAPVMSMSGPLIFRGPGECPGEAALRERVERRLGVPLDHVVHGVTVTMSYYASTQRYVAKIDPQRMDPGREVRVVTSVSCDELTSAVAVVVARWAKEATEELTTTPPPAPAKPRQGHWGGGMRMLGLSGIGALPGISIGGELSGSVRHDELFVELGGAHWQRNPSFWHSGWPPNVDLSMSSAVLRVGWAPELLPVRGWCGVEVGWLAGDMMSTRAEDRQQVWAGVSAGMAVTWAVMDHARLVGMVELAAPFVRSELVSRSGDRQYRAELAAARYGLGLEFGWQ